MSPNEQLPRRLLRALTAGATGSALADFYAPDVVQTEFPNRLTPSGATRTLADLQTASVRGQEVVASQRYDVKKILAEGDMVVAEIAWRAVMKIPVGAIAAGEEMRADLCLTLQFRDGKIIEQHNYDCFAPF